MADSGNGPDQPGPRGAEGLEPTVAGDPETLAMMRRIESTLFDAPQDAVRVGRFALHRVLGSGGMGVVHLAHDDVLDRRVAIKVIRGERVASEELRTRLLREARAMARLNHANVVQVYEAGEHGGQVFVVMELVEGRTMARWLEAEGAARPWPERLAVLLAAGRGLAAAHRVGLVHRDFKPDNVLLDAQGEVKVADFGLVGVAIDAMTNVAAPRDVDSLTVTGSLVGTPRYMAPEQLMGRPTDARSDQFAFSIVAYEALVGQRPFAGDTFAALCENVTSGAIRPVPRGCPVPRSLLAVVERGLASDPARRWPDMDALLAALSQRRGRARALVVGVLLVLAPTLAIAMRGVGADEPGCEGGTARLAGVWDPARRDQAEAAFLATGKPYAADTFARVAPVLDGYASAWAEADAAACTLATSGDAMSTARVECLEHARGELQFVTSDLALGEPSTILHAVELVGALPELVRCEDPDSVAFAAGSLEDADLRVLVDGLGHAKMLAYSHRLPEADAELIELQSQAAAHHRDALEGHALLLRAKVAHLSAQWQREREHAGQALALAERAERDEIAATAWRMLFHASCELTEYERAAFELERAESLFARGGSDPEQEAQLLYDRARLYGDVGRYGEAIDEYRRAMDAMRAVNPRHAQLPDVLVDMSKSLLLAGEQDEAILAAEDALRMRAELVGPRHPAMVMNLLLVANVYVAAGRFADALRVTEQALEVAQLNPDQRPDLLPTIAAMTAQCLVSLGRFDEAERMLERARELAETHVPESMQVRGYIAMGLGNLHLDQREFERAVEQYELARAAVKDSFQNRAIATSNLAYALACAGRLEEALARSREAVADASSMAVDARPRVGIAIYDAEVHRLAGRNEEARALFLSALPVLDRIEADPGLRFVGYFGAAQLELDPELALRYIDRAAEALEQMPSLEWQREAVATWRAQHDRGTLHVRG